MRLREFAPSPERDHNDDVPDPIFVLANRWWNAGDKQPQIEHVLNSLGWSIHQVESEDDAVQLQHRDGTTHFISADDFDPDLFEAREGVMQLIRQYLPGWPDYVIKDWLAHKVDGRKSLEDMKTDLKWLHNYVVNWKFYPKMPLTMDMMNPDTRYRIKIKRNYGRKNPWNIPDDEKRMTKAHQLVRDKGMENLPPILLTKTPQGFELMEGWHRTMAAFEQALANNPNGIVVNAWICEPGPGYKAPHPLYTNKPPKPNLPKESSTLDEIARIPQSELGDWGETGTLAPPKTPVKKKELPGGSGYTYAVEKTGQGNIEIMIFDGDDLAAELDLFETQDVLNTWGVETVVVERPYRGQGLGKALYGIALSILKLTIEAGQTQTRHGQAMWLMLNSIPGVEVKGYNMVPTDRYQPNKNDTIVKQDVDWTRYTFPVESGTRSMRSARRGTGLYNSQATMIAKWTGR
jgi:GNAT superfamily N-acetyltransferase